MYKVFFFLVGCVGLVQGGVINEKLQSLHREIGNNLIKIKKENPGAEVLVYTVLDQFDRYRSASKDLIAKKHKYKQLLRTEQKQAKGLKEELAKKDQQIEKMKDVLIEASDKLKKDFSAMDKIKEQKELFTKEREKFLKEKEQFLLEKQQFIAERNLPRENHEKAPHPVSASN